MMTFEYTYLKELLLILAVLALLLVSYYYGFWLGGKMIGKKGDKHLSLISNIHVGLTGILGVMLAFSFSLSSTRFEYRRQLIIKESMSIGTAFFRAGLLPDTIKNDVRNLLLEYIDARLKFYKDGNTDEDRIKINSESRRLQVKIWSITAIIGKSAPSLNTNVTILALNEMIDVSGNISSSFQNHLPRIIIILLVIVSMCTIFAQGYCHGFSSDKNIRFALLICIVICSILFLIKDMDAPTSGFLRADIYGLLEIKQEINKYSYSVNK
ncbi:hypothetical protein [Sporocytophaga myxococcoides]|uniref:hypothetical protein n=1 Tax=Sporocytophaga myxococcoides TaxID=153721 RepID=UPI00048D5A8D|nr:hypothetical protein [Sporocytophaga myxococcoides]